MFSKTSREFFDDVATTIEERGSDYGHPYFSHQRIADLWSGYIGYPITAPQVAICMALVKVSRLSEKPLHEDSILDLAAYANIYRMVIAQAKSLEAAREEML